MTQTAAPITSTYLKVIDRNFSVILKNLKDVSHEQSLIPYMQGGSHLNWLMGHLTHSRCGILRTLGTEVPWSEERGKRYGKGSTAATAGDAEPVTELIEAYKATQPLIEQAAARLTEADLERESGGSTVGARFEFLVWHESYHSGQTTLYRRMAGHGRVIP